MRLLPLAGSAILLSALGLAMPRVAAQGRPSGQAAGRGASTPTVAAAPAVTPPEGYVIGPDDVLVIAVREDPTLSGEVTVRPDGKISLAYLNDMQAAGLTPEALRANLTKAVSTFDKDPTVMLTVKAINSRKVYITGQVGKPGLYPLTEHMTVVNLISVAGGLTEFAHKDNIGVFRRVNGETKRIARFNYDDVVDGKAAALKWNIELQPGDQVIVP